MLDVTPPAPATFGRDDLSSAPPLSLLVVAALAGAHTTLTALPIVVALAVVIVLPPLCYLLWLTPTEKWSRA